MSAVTEPAEQIVSAAGLQRRRLGRVGRVLGWMLTVLVVVAWFVVFRPATLGGPVTYVGVNGISMTPTMHDGDLAVVQRRSSYEVGDVIAYRIPEGQTGAGSRVIHRIVGGDGQAGFVTKGDHNAYTDYYWHPRPTDVLGKVWFHWPGLARQMALLRSPTVLAVVVGGLTFVILAWPARRRETDPDPVAEARASLDADVGGRIGQREGVGPSRRLRLIWVGLAVVAVQLAAGVFALVSKTVGG